VNVIAKPLRRLKPDKKMHNASQSKFSRKRSAMAGPTNIPTAQAMLKDPKEAPVEDLCSAPMAFWCSSFCFTATEKATVWAVISTAKQMPMRIIMTTNSISQAGVGSVMRPSAMSSKLHATNDATLAQRGPYFVV